MANCKKENLVIENLCSIENLKLSDSIESNEKVFKYFAMGFFQGNLHLIVPYTQRRLIKITQGDGDEESNREHLPRILLLPGVSIECNTWSFMLIRNQTTQLHFWINIIYSFNELSNGI